MTNKDIHIVFGQSARGMFVHSKKFDLDSIQLICLEDFMNIGPVSDLDSDEGVNIRSQWQLKVFDSILTADLVNIKTLMNNYSNENIYLWTGIDASEIIHTARLLYNLQPCGNNVYMFDFSIFSQKNIYRQTVYPRVLKATDLNNVDDPEKYFRLLTEEELTSYMELWKRIKSENHPVWILENNQIVGKDEDYFDSFLLSYCTNEFQSPAWIIGNVLCDIDFVVSSDAFLNYRLKQLVNTNKLEARGEMKAIRDYMVRLKS